MMELLTISYSPWSERARWSLLHHGLAHRERPYAPLLDEPWLRWRLRRPWAPVSVPVLFLPDGRALTDSWDIARHADTQGTAPPLLPERHLPALQAWAAQADRCLTAGRVRTSLQTRDTPAAWTASLPPPLRGAPPSVAGRVVRMGVWHLLRKYGGTPDVAQCEAEMRGFLLALRDGLTAGGGFLVGGRLSWADLCAASALQFISPVDSRWVPLSEPVRPCWTTPALARGFADVLAWRDTLYDRHRPPRVAAAKALTARPPDGAG